METKLSHYSDVIMGAMASQITSLTIVYSTVYSGSDQRKHHSSASLAFVRGIHRWPVNSPHKGPVMQKMFPFNDIIMLPKLHGHWLNPYCGYCIADHMICTMFCVDMPQWLTSLNNTTFSQSSHHRGNQGIIRQYDNKPLFFMGE